VLDTLVESAARLCRAERASITLPKGHVYHRVASYGFSAEFKEYMDRHPLAIERGNIAGRVVKVRPSKFRISDLIPNLPSYKHRGLVTLVRFSAYH
jgi:two-component system, NtrC family, sensor kinase